MIEKYTKNTRFCLICNYVSKIIPALQSRCTRFRFGPLQKEQIKTRLQTIIEAEKCDCLAVVCAFVDGVTRACVARCVDRRLNVTPDGMNAILRLSGGDMRRVLNILQVSAVCKWDSSCW